MAAALGSKHFSGFARLVAGRSIQATASDAGAAEIDDDPTPDFIPQGPSADLWAQINSCWY
jgi:hypothetical protein